MEISQKIVAFSEYMNFKGLGLLKLADIVLSLINPSPCYVKDRSKLREPKNQEMIMVQRQSRLFLVQKRSDLLKDL